MRRWIKWLGVAGAMFAPGATLAADHADGPAVQAMMNPGADINDVFSFMSADNLNLTMILSTGGLMAAAPSSQFLYVLHVGRTDMALGALTAPATAQTNVICQFDVATDVECWVVDTSDNSVLDYATGDASTSLTSASTDLRIHVGTHADPFFFHLAGFNAARGAVQAGFAALGPTLNADGCPAQNNTINFCTTPVATVAQVLQRLLNGQYSAAVLGGACTAGTAANTFATGNIQAIVIELDKTKIAGTGEFFQVWGATHN